MIAYTRKTSPCYLVTCLALLFALLQAAPQPSAPPRTVEVLQSDSLVVIAPEDHPDNLAWTYQLIRTSESGSRADVWLRLQDPYGGSVSIPTVYAFAISEDARAFAEQRARRSVLFVPKPAVLAVLIASVGLVVAVPTVLVRRRLRRERGRRRDAERARVHLAEGREAERLRIARDLHDGPVQHLQVLRLRLASLAEGPVSPDVLDRVAADVQAVTRDLRRTSEDLRPPMLGPFGLAAALETLAEQVGRDHPSIDVSADLEDDGQTLPEPVRLALFRVAQEAVSNAIRHGQPTRVDLSLRLAPRAVHVEIADDGVGFEPPDDLLVAVGNGRYGLVGMAERAEILGATLNVESRPGEGTRVRVSAPLP